MSAADGLKFGSWCKQSFINLRNGPKLNVHNYKILKIRYQCMILKFLVEVVYKPLNALILLGIYGDYYCSIIDNKAVDLYPIHIGLKEHAMLTVYIIQKENELLT